MPPTVRVSVVVAAFMEAPKDPEVETLNTDVPDPFWISKAVVEARFRSNPPAPVNPERKDPEELFTWKRLAVWVEFPVMSCPWMSEALTRWK